MGWQAGRMMSGLARALAGVLLLAAMACTPIYRNHGFAPTDADLALLTVGTDTRDTVATAIGRPSAAGLLNDDGWYYVQSRYRHFGPQQPREIERTLVAVTFDAEGTVTNIERFGLEDGRVIVLSRRVTETNIKGVSLISQLLGNIGRVNIGDFVEE